MLRPRPWGSLERRLADRAPWLGRVRRSAVAAMHALLPPRASYAQHGEDRWFLVRTRGIDLTRSIYVDVGASHPTRISNTYLLYRRGLRGVLVEPNAELATLLRRTRPRDVAIVAACGDRSGAAELCVASTPVLSHLASAGAARSAARVVRMESVPLRPLDELLVPWQDRWVSLLSVDAEGGDAAVLRGAPETLRRTLFLCVEANDVASEGEITALLAGRFILEARLGCNLLLRNADADKLLVTWQ